MKRALSVIALAACSGRDKQPPPPPPADASGFVHPPMDARAVDVAPADWVACKKAIEAAPKTPAMRRVQAILGACKPCGDWKPLLDWNIEAADGGPTREQIEDSMIACKAYCNTDAKVRFLGTLDKFRGRDTRGPWRFLGDLCKEQISAVPDNRYASAPWFALDRIARAAGERPEIAPLLDAFDIPLPVISISGYGFELAKSPVTAPDAGPLALTVTPQEIRLAVVARAKLSRTGVITLSRGDAYPGTLVKTKADLEAAIARLADTGSAAKPGGGSAGSAATGSGAGSSATGSAATGSGAGPSSVAALPPIDPAAGIAIFAPHGMAAVRLLDALAITGERPRILRPATPGKPQQWLLGDVRLAVQADGGPPGWQLSGSIPVALRTSPVLDAIHVDLDDNPDPIIEGLKADKGRLLSVIAKHRSPDEQPGSLDPPTAQWKPALAIHLGPKATVAGLAKLIGAAVYFDVKSVALLRGRAPSGPGSGSGGRTQ